MAIIDKKVIKVGELLCIPNLHLPEYQRPYKWTTKNIHQLLSDIATHKDKSCYRLGTVVFHQEQKDAPLNIVDGQQRIITLLLAVHALAQRTIEGKDLAAQLESIRCEMVSPEFDSDISKQNIRLNYAEISRIVGRSDFTEEMIDFLLNKCEVVTFTLNDISEAFQFFDAQNARGRDLAPHDLLKAYHLREFAKTDEALKQATVAQWEAIASDDLEKLFAEYLYRIRNWAKGNSARYFRKEDVALFKGVNLERAAHHPYVEPVLIAHHFVDDYNGHYQRRIDGNERPFPFQLDQVIINGRRFFEMTSHYHEKISSITMKEGRQALIEREQIGEPALNIMKVINEYPGMHRTGDRYVRALFDCLLIYYLDKFGNVELSRAIEKCFIWAYSLRLRMQAVRLATMDNYALEQNLFKVLRDATRPDDFLQIHLPSIQPQEIKQNEEALIKLFDAMNYYDKPVAP